MMLKVGSEYLDFTGSVEVERKAKLFENLDSSDGDFSFAFEVPETSHNIRILNYPVPDSSSKTVYNRIDCDLQDDAGVSLHEGFLRVERRVKRDFLSLSFFSGNSNWFGLISGNLSDMDMSAYDTDQTTTAIETAWANTEGVAFPLIDNGGLLTRSNNQVKVEDFVGGLYVHTVFKKIFQDSQIKIQGELFDEPLYNKLITIKNSKSQEEIDARASFVSKNSTQSTSAGIDVLVTFDDETSYPYYDGSQNNFNLSLSRYVADVKMNVKAETSLTYAASGLTFTICRVSFYVNGVEVESVVKSLNDDGQPNPDNDDTIVSLSKIIPLEAGDYLEVWTDQNQNLDISFGTFKITPNYIYKTYGTAALPNWTKQDYVSSIFQVFNVLTSFDPKTKTLTCNLFDKIKDKEPIDISQYVEVDEVDYTEFISSYGKKSTFSYNEVEFDEVKDYNIANFFKYGQGFLTVNNDFIDETKSVIESSFSNPFSYINGVFDMSMERTNLIALEEDESVEVTSVTDNSGIARINIADNIFIVGDLVRIKDATNQAYNGDWVVNVQAAGYIEVEGLPYDTNATAEVFKLEYTYNNSDDVYLMVNIPTYPVPSFSGNLSIMLEDVAKTSFGVAYFSLLNTARQINTDYKQSLSFGEISDPLFYQRTILETYWSLVSRVLNDPVKPICTGMMPANVYRSIDFLRPLLIKTLETSNLYYANLLSGYVSSYEPFRIELIKLP